MARYLIPRIAHCSQGHAMVPGMTENCPVESIVLDPDHREPREILQAKPDRLLAA
jgi:hypothetical protein